jgi:hypothetical protein
MTKRVKKGYNFFNKLLVLLVFLITTTAQSQDWAKSLINNLQRVDLRTLGYPMVNEIPENSSAITSLILGNDDKIYGGTSGEIAYIFLFNPITNKVKHLGRIKGQESIHHALVQDSDGYIYIGTGKDMFREIEISKGRSGEDQIDKIIWRDIKNHFKDYDGGHLYRYNPKASNDKVKLPDMACEVDDLGIPVPNNSIYALTINTQRNEIYGLTYPDGHFFVYSIESKKYKDLGEIDEQLSFHGPERYWRSLPRALVCDDSGRVFTSSTSGILKYYSPRSQKIESTDLKIPGDYYYNQFYTDYTVVEYFIKNDSGLIYGGTSDGYLFSLDIRKMELLNLGKPRADRRLRCLTMGKDGKIYLMAGERSQSRPCQFYTYDPKSRGFEELGLLIVDRSPYYYWRGYQFDCMVTGADGTIYIGESERRSHLFLFIP